MPLSPRRGLARLLARLLGRIQPPAASGAQPRGYRRSPHAAALADLPADHADGAAASAPAVTGAESEQRGERESAHEVDLTPPLSLARIEAMLTGPMGYAVERRQEAGHSFLVGNWDDFPFVIEEPEEHEGWLLVSGDATEPLAAGEREEIGASVNDWNRDKFFPTVAVIDTPVGPMVRATYLMDLTSGVSDAQLRLHLETALSACIQALSQVGPLLPEL
ncbi:YbjN domain-containing protein [Actinomyces faecalis]|uniref:YbjN domain-containing protein n=1 Tax=Actinomyces faecalis TaxID=2722820 RepID=UPI001555B4AD|nr:YbjN domain-containing protein [Actinomyces faecalis]